MRESELLQHIYASNNRLGADIVVPPGDDMGMIRIGGADVLVAVDQLVAGRHFRLEATPLHLIGRKALTRNLSDVAAMAAVPRGAVAAVTLPALFGPSAATGLFDAMRLVAEEYNCPLIGGDIAMHAAPASPLICTVTVFAEPTKHGVVTRNGAQPGDAVYVTGALGGSLERNGLGRHLTFTPRIDAALELHDRIGERLHALIDISDGLGRDAANIARASGVQIVIDSTLIPLNAGVTWREALSDGEDYELLFAAAGDVPAESAGVTITRIGEVHTTGAPGEAAVFVRHDGQMLSADQLGWEHIG